MMRRLTLALLLPTLLAAAPPAAAPSADVTSLRLEPREGRTELTVAVSGGDVKWSDFRLGGPPRVVLDIAGARTGMGNGRFEGINRGGIASVRTSQYLPDVVRVVMVLDRSAEYTVARTADGIKVSFAAGSGQFQPWSSGAQAPVRTAARPQPASPLGESGAPRASQQPSQQRRSPARRITVTFENTAMRDVLASFAEFSGRSIVPGAEVAGIVVPFVEIRNQPWDEALRAILQSFGLAAVEEPSGIIRVDALANVNARQRQEALSTQPFRINYVPATELQATIQPILTERGSIATNATTNTLIVTDVPSVVEDVRKLIAQLDIQTPQVAIQAKIVFINRTDAEELGITYDLKDSRGSSINSMTSIPDASGTQTNANFVSLGGNSIAALGNANSRVQGPSLQIVSSLVLGRYTLVNFLEALQSAQLSDVQASPVVTTLSNREANVWVGERTPIRVVDVGSQGTGSTARSTSQLVETGIRLIVTPQVTSDRKILMQIHAERSAAQPAPGEIGVSFSNQSGDTRVMVADGETAVLGGLTVTEVTGTRVGIPFLMDIPVLGALFRHTSNNEQKRDLLIMVTPHIVENRP
ncbi:MAG: type and secretion system protein [Gemmatimonadetes bacterium]|nr:type and secretion system protein [Gemmatimonadota bacterium]